MSEHAAALRASDQDRARVVVALVVAGRETSEIVLSANETTGGPTVIDVFDTASLPIRRAMLQLDR